ncbi:histidine kinase [Staphylococcus saprophyticus]|uniref:sensor histidine kinase n=1 Tax=Staphylococcus saprophyticus TaxID=29385 RepID=UPI0008530B37|nr:sensor histidine kinase [Staphylococcus saprophyticus]MDW3895525.1 sensor histidine kinase [Staphylococcus saprophyticus]OEK74058.1 histidine kinase [Staphylococcus saprophyticus]
MLNLFILLLERVGLIILIAYILMNINHFKTMMNEREKRRSQWQLIIIFGCFSMISNFTGIQIRGDEIINGTVYNHLDPDASLANTRVLTIGVSGLIGGPFVALAVAVISGMYRVYIGGADAYIYLISSIFIALISGYFGYKAMRANRYPTIVKGACIGGTTEIIQMLCILLFSDNTEHAWTLVKLIAIPMISINSIGTAIFLSIILSTIKQEEETRAIQTHDVLQLANQTLPYFRSGLNEQSAKKAAEIILNLMRVSAVAITNRKDILTHVGVASDHHVAQKAIITNLSKRAIQSGTLKEAYSSEEIGCNHPGCLLEAAIVVPLRVKNDVVGTLKLYFTNKYDVNYSDKQLATGLAEIFSSQLELGQAETQSALIRDAEIKSLQAQVNPHFFFNAINTISALVRIDSEKARELLLQLSQFFRSNLQGARNNTISLEKELQQVESYLSLEQARYPDRFNVSFDIDRTCYGALVPPFAIQILVENAIKHAFKNRKYNNEIIVKAHKAQTGLVISVSDNGHGIPYEKLDKIGKTSVHSESGTGSALENLNRRLDGLFGYEASLQIHSDHQGTQVSCTIPYHNLEEEKIESNHCR